MRYKTVIHLNITWNGVRELNIFGYNRHDGELGADGIQSIKYYEFTNVQSITKGCKLVCV